MPHSGRVRLRWLKRLYMVVTERYGNTGARLVDCVPSFGMAHNGNGDLSISRCCRHLDARAPMQNCAPAWSLRLRDDSDVDLEDARPRDLDDLHMRLRLRRGKSLSELGDKSRRLR